VLVPDPKAGGEEGEIRGSLKKGRKKGGRREEEWQWEWVIVSKSGGEGSCTQNVWYFFVFAMCDCESNTQCPR